MLLCVRPGPSWQPLVATGRLANKIYKVESSPAGSDRNCASRKEKALEEIPMGKAGQLADRASELSVKNHEHAVKKRGTDSR